MKMKGKEWVILIVLMVVIAFVVAYLTGAITGNAVLSSSSKIKPNDKATYLGVLGMLNKGCQIVKDGQTSGVISCNEICTKALGSTPNMYNICIIGSYQGVLRPCSDTSGSINTDRFCDCCKI